jgi:hypothetical protein
MSIMVFKTTQHLQEGEACQLEGSELYEVRMAQTTAQWFFVIPSGSDPTAIFRKILRFDS